jgi:4'-phosphopantetheinyl transferase
VAVAPRNLDVWLVPLDGTGLVSHEEAWARLSPDERERAERYARADDRRRFVVGRGALRTVLADRLGGQPADVRLTSRPGQRPVLAGSAGVCFSVSHSGGLVACALADAPVGIDVQARSEVPDDPLLRVRSCAPGEDAGPDGFARRWARKEAVIKALPDGSDAAPSSIDVTRDRTSRWWVQDIDAGPAYAAAVAGLGRRRPVVVIHTQSASAAAVGT